MDTTRIDLNLLVTFEALLAEQNVTKAAARLNLSQPAVSAQLNRLREMFDDPLLVPARRGMTPTAKALELLGPLRDALDQLRRTLQTHKDFHPQSAQLTLTIACTDYIQAAVVMPLVLALRQRGHPALSAELSMEAFAQLEQVIVSPSGGGFTTPIDEALATFGLERRVVMSAASFLFVPQIVAISDLVALVPRRLLQQVMTERLAQAEVPWLAEQFEVSMIWHERNHGHAGQRWVREVILGWVKEKTAAS